MTSRMSWRVCSPSAPSSLRRATAAAQPYLYLLPAFAGLIVWIYLPLGQTVRLSFFEWDLLPTSPMVGAGLSKYEQALRTPDMAKATLNTGIYIVVLVPFALVIPLGVALTTRSLVDRSRAVYRALVFLPFLLAPVATAILWRWLLATDGGLVNRAIEALGGGSVNWLREATPALIAIAVITGWKLIGLCMLMVSAGLASINGEYAQAASVDGATQRQITRWVTLALLSPTLLLSDLGWLNSLVGVIVPQITAAFAVLMLRQHMRSFPRERLDAARMDGLSSWATLWRVVVPTMRAPLSALTILLFVTAWNEYLWPRIVLQQGTSVIQTGLQSFLTDTGNDCGALMAAAGLVTLPVLVLYVLLQRRVVDAFMRSGLR